MIARVRGDMAEAKDLGHILRSSLTSVRTGVAPAAAITHADAIKEFAAVTTSSPCPISKAFSGKKCSGPVSHAYGMFHPTVVRYGLFKLFNFWPQNIRT